MTENDYDVDVYDVINFIESATPRELDKIKQKFLPILGMEDFITADNLYDREKVIILKEAMNKYNLDELRKKLE